MVADVEEEEGDGDDEDDGPEIDELGGEDGGVAVGEDGEVVPFDVEEGENDVCVCGWRLDWWVWKREVGHVG